MLYEGLRYAVYIREGELPALETDDREEALAYWKANHRKLHGQVGVCDRSAKYPWIA